MNRIAIEFVRNILKQNPEATDFGDIYDAMTRAACQRSLHNLGYEELALAGISFSLLCTNELEHLIAEARESLAADEWSPVHPTSPAKHVEESIQSTMPVMNQSLQNSGRSNQQEYWPP